MPVNCSISSMVVMLATKLQISVVVKPVSIVETPSSVQVALTGRSNLIRSRPRSVCGHCLFS
jgi:hypothetical protein